MAKMLNLVEKHMALWELKRRLLDLAQRPGRCLDNGIAYGPCLLISRQRGSGGDHLARLIGERLGWHVFDREILDEIAQMAHVRTEVLNSVDKAAREKWENEWVPELQPEDIGLESYLRFLRHVVLALGHHGDVVILGRGSQFLLPPGCALRVRVVAPLETRVKRKCQFSGGREDDVRLRIQKIDAERSMFTRRCFRQDIDSPLAYDIVVNTGEINVDGAVELVLETMRLKLGVPTSK
jgi:cytidylate kinase